MGGVAALAEEAARGVDDPELRDQGVGLADQVAVEALAGEAFGGVTAVFEGVSVAFGRPAARLLVGALVDFIGRTPRGCSPLLRRWGEGVRPSLLRSFEGRALSSPAACQCRRAGHARTVCGLDVGFEDRQRMGLQNGLIEHSMPTRTYLQYVFLMFLQYSRGPVQRKRNLLNSLRNPAGAESGRWKGTSPFVGTDQARVWIRLRFGLAVPQFLD